MKKISSVILSLIMLLNLSGCATTKMDPLQRRVMESKDLEGKYEDAFKATMAILQDGEFTIKTSDFAAGHIYAEWSTETAARPSPAWLLLTPLFGAGLVAYGALSCGKRPYSYRMTVNLEAFTDDIVKMRISIAGVYDNSKTETITDPKTYQTFFADVQREMFRRAQLNK